MIGLPVWKTWCDQSEQFKASLRNVLFRKVSARVGDITLWLCGILYTVLQTFLYSNIISFESHDN